MFVSILKDGFAGQAYRRGPTAVAMDFSLGKYSMGIRRGRTSESKYYNRILMDQMSEEAFCHSLDLSIFPILAILSPQIPRDIRSDGERYAIILVHDHDPADIISVGCCEISKQHPIDVSVQQVKNGQKSRSWIIIAMIKIFQRIRSGISKKSGMRNHISILPDSARFRYKNSFGDLISI